MIPEKWADGWGDEGDGRLGEEGGGDGCSGTLLSPHLPPNPISL